MGKSRRLLMAALLLGLVGAGCGTSPTSKSGAPGEEQGAKAKEFYQSLQGLSPDERQKRLSDEAKKEGTLVLYTSFTNNLAEEVKAAFEREFGIDVELYRANSEEILQRVQQEAAAPKYAGADLVETNVAEMSALAGKNIFIPVDDAARDGVIDEAKFDGWTGDRYNVFAPSWNTQKVAKGEAPKTWEALADPKWRGKLTIETEDWDWYMGLYQHLVDKGMSKADVDALFRRIAQNSRVVKGHSVQREMLVAGRFGVQVSSYTYMTDEVAADGAPVDYQPIVEPAVARPNGVGVPAGAQHPAAALLFHDWILTKGQKMIAEAGMLPVSNSVDNPFEDSELVFIDPEQIVAEGNEWSERYRDNFLHYAGKE